jgi:hypothetical protein
VGILKRRSKREREEANEKADETTATATNTKTKLYHHTNGTTVIPIISSKDCRHEEEYFG